MERIERMLLLKQRLKGETAAMNTEEPLTPLEPSLTIIKVPLTDEEMFERLDVRQAPQKNEPPIEAVAKTNVAPVTKSTTPLSLVTLRQRIGGPVAFTVTDRVDGIGAQALAKISAMVMAEALKCEYAHIPFSHLEHCDSNMKLSTYCERWDNVLQLSPGRLTYPKFPNTHNLCKSDALIQLQSQSFKVGHLYCFRDCHSFTEAFRDDLRDAWRTIILMLRGRRALASAKPLTGTFNVAVHIRRGDVSDKDSKRWTSDDYYIEIIKRVKEDFPAAQFHIVSEGDEADFNVYRNLFDDPNAVHLHISPKNTNNRTTKSLIAQPQRQQFVAGASRNQIFLNRRGVQVKQVKQVKPPEKSAPLSPTVFDAFEILVAADVLIMSKSTFSFLAALYSSGRKICHPDMWLSVPKWCEENDYWVSDVKRLF